jgi:hypothetical protein
MRAVIIDTYLDLSHTAANDEHFGLSQHALMRMSQRSIDLEQVQLVLSHGKMMHSRRARFYVVGKKDVKRLAKAGLDTQNLENIQVVVEEKSNTIVTVYRNKDFRHIRPTSRRERHMG